MMTAAYPFPAVALPSGVQRDVGPIWEEAARGLERLLRRFGPPALARAHNGAPDAVRVALILLARLQAIVRCLLAVYAAQLNRDRARAAGLSAPVWTALDPRPPRQPRAPKKPRPRRAENPADPSTWTGVTAFARPRPWRRPYSYVDAPRRPQPAQLRGAPRNPMRLIARRMEGLRRVLSDPMPHIERMAKRLIRAIVLKPRFFKRRRRREPDDYREQLYEARAQARWALDPYNTG